MAGEWHEVTVGDFAPFAYGKGLPEHQRDPFGDIPVFGSNGTVGVHSEALTSGPTVIIGRKGTVGAVHYSEKPCWPIDTTFYVTDPDTNVLRFKYYLLKSLGLEHMNADSAVPGLNREAAHARKVRIPPLPEQRAIAHILGTLDDKIELNRRMSRTLEEMARAIFKSWFVDFDPVRAKAAVRREHPDWPNAQVSRAACPNMKPEIAELFPDRLVDSKLGEIPEGWEVKAIGDLAEVVGGSTPKTERTEYWAEGTHHWVTPKDLSALSMPVLLDTERKITDAGLAQISSGLLPKGTVLLSSRAPIGYLAISEVPVAVNQGFIAMKPRPGTSNLFLLRWAGAAHDEIVSHANGSTFLEISKSNFRPIRVVTPPTTVMDAFDRVTRPLYLKVVDHEHESRTLAALRDALLPKLISGEIRVKDAGRFLKDRGL
ncbi:MAG: restriction endonuclease subunit S [bacterium]|nr:restriction endonuclease subunit S [bacterium]